MKKLAIFILLWAFVLGCAKTQLIDLTGEEYFNLGLEYLEKKKYTDARGAFENALLIADTPKLARDSQYLLARTKFLYAEDLFFSDTAAWLDAIASYEAFAEYYVDDDTLPECYYQLGIMYANISAPPRADQTFTESSVKNLEKLKDIYPTFFEEVNAGVTLEKMRAKLAEHEYQVAMYYYRIDKPESAKQRLLYMMRNYPGSVREENALAELTLDALKGGDAVLARLYYGELAERYPNSKELSRCLKADNKTGFIAPK